MSYPQAYIRPSQTAPLPQGLTLTQFIQSVIVGVSGLDGTLVRPKWQIEPPKQPSILTNWIGMGVTVAVPDANLFIDADALGAVRSQRHESLEVDCSIYGPEGLEIAATIADGLQVPTNLEALRYANMGFVEVSPARRIPDLVNQVWVDRLQMSVFFRREIQRVYPIVTLVSASGKIHSVIGDEEYLLDWAT